MKKIKRTTVYLLLMNLLFLLLPQLNVNANDNISLTQSMVAYSQDGTKVILYEENNKDSKQLIQLENETEVFVLRKDPDFVNVQYEIPEKNEVWIGYIESNQLITAEEAQNLNSTDSVQINSSGTTENESSISLNTTNTTFALSPSSVQTSSEKLEGLALQNPTNMYSAPDRNSAILKSYSPSSMLFFYEYSENWYKSNVNINGAYQTVYIYKKDIDLESSDSTIYEGVTIANQTNLYTFPSDTSEVKRFYNPGTIVNFYLYTSEWYKVIEEQSGTSTTYYLKKADVEQVTTNPVKLEGVSVQSPTNVYSLPTKDSNIVKSFSKGSILLFYTYTSDWFKSYVSINNKIETIYIPKNDIELVESNPEKLQGISIQSPTMVYELPSTSSRVIQSFSQGKILRFYTYTKNWYKSYVSVNGRVKTIFINSKDVDLITSSPQKFEGISIKSPTNMYAYPTKESKILKTFSPGRVLLFYSYTTDWYRSNVYTNGRLTPVYISKNDVELADTSPVKKEGISLKSPTNLYEQPTRSSKVLRTFKSGVLLKFFTYSSGWYRSNVYVNGRIKPIFIDKNDVDLLLSQSKRIEGIATAIPTNLYASPSRESRVLRSFRSGFKLVYYSYTSDWMKSNITINGVIQPIYINKHDIDQLVDTQELNEGVTLKSPTNFYEMPNRGSKVLRTFPKGATVKYYTLTTNWYKSTVNVNGINRTIYIAKEDIGQVKPATTIGTFLVNENLNVRTNPDTGSSVLTTIPKGTLVEVVSKYSSDWYKVYYQGFTGFASEQFLTEVLTGDPLYSRDSYQFIDLRTTSPVTAAQINKYIADNIGIRQSVLRDKGQAFIDLGNKYGVNALYLAAHAIHESGFGTSNISLGKYNLFGFGAFDATPFIAAYRFVRVEENIDYIAREIKATYLNPLNWKYKGAYLGFSTKYLNNSRIDSNSEGMNYYYASDPKWGQKIASHMEKILPYDKNYYSKEVVNTSIPARPGIPSGSDVFPSGVMATAKTDITFSLSPDSSDTVKVLKAGDTFYLLQKNNDYWVKVDIDGKVFWTDDIRFDIYKSYMIAKNLGRVTVDQLNVRSGPSTDTTKISTLALNQYISIVLKPDGTISKSSDGNWYEVNLEGGKTGWVYSLYINQELN